MSEFGDNDELAHGRILMNNEMTSLKSLTTSQRNDTSKLNEMEI